MFKSWSCCDGKEMQKRKRDARAKLLFGKSKPIAFLPFLLTSPLSLLKLSNNNYETNLWCSLRKDKVVWMHSQMRGWILLKWMDIYEEELKTIIISKAVMIL